MAVNFTQKTLTNMLKTKQRMKDFLRKKPNPFRLPFFMAMLFSIMSSFSVVAQENVVNGTITDEKGIPLPSINVVQKGTTNGVVTDFNGNYSITLVSGNRTLVFSSLGFGTQEVAVGGRTTININMQEDVESLDEVVVLGYNPTLRKNILGAVESIKAEEITQNTPTSTLDGIQGRLSGVQIIGGGAPGEPAAIQIRGASTFGTGSNPLYVVDGQQLEDIDNLNPNDIASLEVVKDAGTAAVYGSRAANGVIIITTKIGKTGKTRVDINHDNTISVVNNYLPLSNTRERLLYEDRRRNGDPTSLIGGLSDSLSLFQRTSNDLQDLLFRTAYRNQVNIAVSGGSEKVRFYWNNGFIDEQGVVINSKFKRANTSLKLDFQVNNKLRLGTRINASFDKRSGLNESSVFREMTRRIAYFPLFEPDGSYTPRIAGLSNPVAQADLAVNDTRRFRGQMFNYAQWQITPKLSAKVNLGINFEFRKINQFSPTLLQNSLNNPPRGRERDILSYDIQQEAIITYRNTFGSGHTITALAGTQVQQYNREDYDTRVNAFTNDYIQTLNNATLDGYTSTSTKSRHSTVGFFGDVSYDYKNKYIIGGTLRRDGSSRFGSDNRYGTFPALKLGWRLSSESFMSGADFIDDLKLSATIGTVGNERGIGDYESQILYSSGFLYDGVNGIGPGSQLGNTVLGWESTTSTNYGLTLSMFNQRFNLGVDIWKKSTEDLLFDRTIPAETGYTGIPVNLGKFDTEGIDIVIGGIPIKTKDFEWETNFNISFQSNKIISLPDGIPFEDDQFLFEEGAAIGNFFGFKHLGVFQWDESNAFDDNGSRLTPVFENEVFTGYTLNGQAYTGNVNRMSVNGNELQGGDSIWEDLDGDFNITDDDKQIIGNGISDYYGGFSNRFTYKQWSFAFLFDFNFGNDIFRFYDQERNHLTTNNPTPAPERILNAWVRQGDIAEYANLDINRRGVNRIGPSSQYINQGDYIKLRNIRLGYDFSRKTLDKISWISRLSLYATANEIVTWTNYPGYNPELRVTSTVKPGVDRLRYPSKTSFILGIRAQL